MDDQLIELLLYTRILGYELDLIPAYVCHLSQRKRHQKLSYMLKHQHPNLVDASLNFEMSYGQSDNVALYLGRRSFGDGSPYTGKVDWKSRRTLLER